MPTLVQLPVHRSPARRVSARTFLKRLLPFGEVRHPEHHVQLDREALGGMVREFSASADGQVPVVLGRGLDPERWRGNVNRLELRDDGLYGTIETSAQGAALLDATPDLPLSAAVARLGAAGRRLALAHVSALPDAGGAVELSHGADVIDLSNGGSFGEPPRVVVIDGMPYEHGGATVDTSDADTIEAERLLADLLELSAVEDEAEREEARQLAEACAKGWT